MRKFWTVVANAGYGIGTKNSRENYPDLPAAVGQRSWTMPGDIRVAEEGAGAAAHNHLLHGSVALPSSEAGDGHYHWIVPLPNGGIAQTYVGSGTPHNHPGELVAYPGEQDYVQPKYYVLLITCDDAEYTNLVNNGVVVLAERTASQVDDGQGGTEWVYAPLSTTTWGAGKISAVTTRLNNLLGLERPSVIDNDKKLIMWLLDFGAWRPEREDKHG